jgi:hypothetical protein
LPRQARDKRLGKALKKRERRFLVAVRKAQLDAGKKVMILFTTFLVRKTPFWHHLSLMSC